MKISVDVVINAPGSRVWEAITDIEHSADMVGGIISAKVLHRPDEGLVGLRWMETRKMWGRESTETMWMTDSKDGEYYCARAENCGVIYTTRMALSAAGDGTTLRMSFSGRSDSRWMGWVTSLMGLLIRKSMIRMLEQDLADIKAFVEKG